MLLLGHLLRGISAHLSQTEISLRGARLSHEPFVGELTGDHSTSGVC